MTLAMTRCGTPYWTAPEIIQGHTYNETGISAHPVLRRPTVAACPHMVAVTIAVDVFAFGMCLLEILTGQTPWQAGVPAGAASKQMPPIKCMQLAVAGKRPEIPAGTEPRLAKLTQACWTQMPAERPTFKQVSEGGPPASTFVTDTHRSRAHRDVHSRSCCQRRSRPNLPRWQVVAELKSLAKEQGFRLPRES
jgi:serine/threonine protein kinase